MADLAILVPVLNRPHRVEPVMKSALAATPDAEVLFIADPDDQPEIDTLEAAGADFITHEGNYAQKINRGVRKTSAPLLFFGADDLNFHKGWFEVASSYLTANVGIVGVNDLCSPRVKNGVHATHFLVTRWYANLPTFDGLPGPLCELYDHSFVDDELVQTGLRRSALVFATDSIVEHCHPDNGTAPMDATYLKGRARMRQDKRLYLKRRRRWMSQS